MIWMEDVNLVLSSSQQKILASGEHDILKKGRPEMTEKYYFGLDTASGNFNAYVIERPRLDCTFNFKKESR